MNARDYRDIIGGVLLIVTGLSVGIYVAATLNVGTLSRMGPGMFPASLGALLIGLGALIGVPALFRPGLLPAVEWRPLVFILLAVLVFALTITNFGMVPAVVLMTIMSMLSNDKVNVVGSIMLAAVLSTLAYLIFRLGLGILVEPFSWPF